MTQAVLEQLRSGQLQGQTRLAIAANLTEFPLEILSLAPTLEILDLSGNQLTELPPEFAQLKQLKIFFASQNPFEVFPSVLGSCPELSMIGFKSNRLRSIPESSFPLLLRWLILTDNRLSSLPESIGDCSNLQKLMLAGNQLRSLPESLAQCHQLELLRLSANQLDELPSWLFELPRLAWLACAGNPIFQPRSNLEPDSATSQRNEPIALIDWQDLELGDRLGEGASGVIWKADWKIESENTKPVAVKLFKGAMTSDGLPQEEMQVCLAAGGAANLMGVLGVVRGHPEGQLGLVLPLLDDRFEILGNPPSFETCTRDTFTGKSPRSLSQILSIAQGISQALAHLHDRSILHGDLYAHNILVNPDGHPILSDFGAATAYGSATDKETAFEKLEVRAFGYLLEDLLEQVLESEFQHHNVRSQLDQLKQDCLCTEVSDRPDFKIICQRLSVFLPEA